MTTYGNKYIFNFISQNGDEVEVCIQKKNYSGSFVRRPVGRGPVLKRERNGAILGTSLELYAECRIDQEYVELYTSSADEFRVLVYKNRELQWTGFVSPELYAEPDIAPPYDVQIIAVDGLGELKNTLFDRPDESYPLGDHIDYILRKTGLSLSVDLISSLSWDDEAHNNSPSSLLSLTANLTHLASNSDYDVLQDILTSFNACITQQAGRWMIVRKTDIYNNIPLFRTAAFGSVNKTTWWPIGSLSADIVPAKRKLTLTHENNYKDSILPGLISGVSGGWEFATGVYYNDSEKAYILSDEDYIIYAMEFPVYPISVPLKLSINARPLFNSSEEDRAVLGCFVELEGTVNGVRGTYYLVHSYDDALGRAVWQWYPERIPLMRTWWREELPEDVEQEVTTVNAVLPLGDNIRPDRIRLIVQNYPIISKYAIAVYDIALAQNDQIRGLKLIAEVGNNARESVETSVVISSSADPMLAETMYGVLRLDGGITSWHTPYNAALDLLKFLAADYAMLTALPAIRYRGTLNVPAQVTPWIPFIFERDNTYYLLETYSYDLLLDELEVELVSIPNSRVSIESETIIEIPAGGLSGSGTVSGGGGSSSGGGSGEGDNEGSTLIVDSEMDDESENAVQNKVIKAYVDAADNLIREEIEKLTQQTGADTPSSFYHDMAAIVSHAGMITRQTREQLYNLFLYTEGDEIPSDPVWVTDTNGQHYIVRMLQTETGVGFFIIGYEGYTRIEGDNTKTNQLLRDKADKKYVDNTFFSQAQFDQIASNQYVVGNVAYQTDSDTGLRRLSLSLGLRIQNDIDAAVNDRPDDNGNYTNGLATALGVKNWVENKGYLTSAAMNGYATKDEIKNFVTKGTTLAHYGITDAVKVGASYSTGTDINDAIAAGTYTVFGASSNTPGSGALLTMTGSYNYYIGQLCVIYNGELYVRAKSDQAGADGDYWSEWRTVIDSVNVGDYTLPKTGGVITGALTVKANFQANANIIMEAGSIKMLTQGNIEGVGSIIHKLSGAYNIDQNGNFYAPSGAGDDNYWSIKRGDGLTAFYIYSGAGKVQTDYDTTLVRLGGLCQVGTPYSKADTKIYGTLYVGGDSTIFDDAPIEYKKTSDGLNKLVISRRVNITHDVYFDGALTMAGRNIEGVGAIIHKYAGAYNMDQYGNFYAASTATDSAYWNFKRADGKASLYVYAGTGRVETAFDTNLGRYGGSTGCTVNMGNEWNRANTNVYGDFKVIGYPAEFKNGITLGNKTITSWDEIKASGDYLPLVGGTIDGSLTINDGEFKVQETNTGNYVQFAASTLKVKGTLVVEDGYSLWLGGEGIVAWAGLKTKLGLKSLAYKDSVAFADISGKPTTLSGYGITDAVVWKDGIDGNAAYKHIGYGYPSNGWRSAGAALSFGASSSWKVQIQASVNADEPLVYFRATAGENQGQWFKFLFSEGNYQIDAKQYLSYGQLVLHRNSEEGETFLNYEPSVNKGANLALFGNKIGFYIGTGAVSAMSINEDKTVSFTGGITLGGETINSWADVGAMPTKSQTTTSGTVSIEPNVLNKWSNALTGTLTINFVSGTSGVANYYMIEFTTGANLPTINLPSGVKWENGFDVLSNLVANTTYQISILNNLAVGGAF